MTVNSPHLKNIPSSNFVKHNNFEGIEMFNCLLLNHLNQAIVLSYNLCDIKRFSIEYRKFICDCFAITFLRPLLSFAKKKLSPHFFNQSEVMPKPIVTCSGTRFPALGAG